MLPVIVFWHRYAAFGEPPSQPPILPRITKRDWRYLLDLIALAGVSIPFVLAAVAIVIAILPLLSFRFDAQDMAPPVAALLAFVLDVGGVALATYVLSRVVLILPATALDQQIGLGEAFRRSRPLALRLTSALWLIHLPAALVDLLAALSTGLSATEMELVVRGRAAGPIAIVVFFNFLAIVISYLLALASAAILTRAFMAAPGFRPAGVDADSSPH